MKILFIVIAVLSLPATLVLSNLFWLRLREARAVAAFLGSPKALRKIVSADLLANPPAEIAQFVQPSEMGHAFNMRAFQLADEVAHNRGRSFLRPMLAAVIIGSGIVGFLAVGWLGLVLPIVNILILHTTFVGSTHGAIDKAATPRAIEHVQITAIILHRWCAQNGGEAAAWLESQSQMKLLGQLVGSPASRGALRSVDDEAVREDVPDGFLELLTKLD